MQLSTCYYEPPAGSLSPSRYEVVKKKEGRAGVYIDGPQQGHMAYVKVIGAAPTATKSSYEIGLDTRRQRLTKEATKCVLAGRLVELLR